MSRDSLRSYQTAIDTASTYSALHNLRRIVKDATILEQCNKAALGERKELKRPKPLLRRRCRSNLTRAQNSLHKTVDILTFIKPLPSASLRLRRKARAICHIIRLCHFCAAHLSSAISSEPWLGLIVNVFPVGDVVRKRNKRNPFMKPVQDENTGKFTLMTFDAVDFSRAERYEGLINEEVRERLRKLPGTRTENDIAMIVRTLKVACRSFSTFSLTTQCLIAQFGFYDKYQHNRVLYQRHRPPHGLYFVLSGLVIERSAAHKTTTEHMAGDMFGREEIEKGCLRQTTVVTKTTSELLFLHKADFKTIFGMAEDARSENQLDICKKDIIFKHFPMQRLEDNPGMWNVWKYGHGRLNVSDSNSIDWFYVVKS